MSTPTTSAASPARDLVARIYEEELRKLIAAAEQNGNATDVAMYNRELTRLAFSKAGGSVAAAAAATDPMVTEDKENFDAGYSSLVIVEENTTHEGPQDLSMSRVVETVSDSSELCLSSAISDSCQSSEDEKQIVTLGADGLSPLQRMQCIANSLPVASSGQVLSGGQLSRPQLPPISTEHLAACDDINTEELVGKVWASNISSMSFASFLAFWLPFYLAVFHIDVHSSCNVM